MAAASSTPSKTTATASAELARSRWWRCLFDTSEHAMIVCRSDSATVEANGRARQMLGLNADDRLPAYLLNSFFTDGTVSKLNDALRRSGSRPETIPAVSLLCRGQLSLIADLQVTPLEDGFSLVTIKDASRRWRMESHVQRLITALNSTIDVVYLTDPEFRITFVNAAFQQVTGHTVEDALGRNASFLRAPSEAVKLASVVDQLARGRDWRGELLNVRHDGSSYPVEASISPVYDRNGAMLGHVAFERDISAQKRLQNDLQLERDYSQSIIESVDAAIYSVDREFRLRHANQNWAKFHAGHGWLTFGAPPEMGRSILDYVPDPAKQAQVRQVLGQVLEDGQPREFQCAIEETRQWLVKVTPWKHGNEVLGLNYVVVDQTRFCQLQSQLFQAQKMETVGALAAGIAHDFNNLLLAIRGNLTLLQMEEGLSDVVHGRLKQIDQAASRAAEITQQLLSFSRSSEEKEVVLDFNEVVREVSQLARRTLKNKVALRIELPEEPIKVRLDHARGNQLLLNLIVNAYDAMPNGGSIAMRNRVGALTADQALQAKRTAGEMFLCCSVSDTGTGIPPEVLPRIFDPFFTTKSKGKGTGLGLAIVHSVISKAGGLVEVSTQPGKGTTFSIYLPLTEAGLIDAPPSEKRSLARGTGRVLVVDDMDFILDFTRSFLSAAGYDPLVATNADEAIATLEEEKGRIDLVLTDYYMPGRSGADLIREAKDRWPHLKFVLASGYIEEEEARRIGADYGVHVLAKPYNVQEATELVVRVLASPTPSPNTTAPAVS